MAIKLAHLHETDDLKLLIYIEKEKEQSPTKKKKFVRRKYCNPGPKYVWHIDGHDKLKLFGFSVHGYIDGFSRKLKWLGVTLSNKVPEIISQYYLKAIKRLKGFPENWKQIGTEHSFIEPIHIYLRGLNEHTVDVLSPIGQNLL